MGGTISQAYVTPAHRRTLRFHAFLFLASFWKPFLVHGLYDFLIFSAPAFFSVPTSVGSLVGSICFLSSLGFLLISALVSAIRILIRAAKEPTFRDDNGHVDCF